MKSPVVYAVVCCLIAAESLPCRAAAPQPRPHPALKHDLDASSQAQWQSAAEPALRLSPEELAALVPKQTPFITCDCPACGAQTYTRSPDRITWKFEWPDHVTCRSCNTTFPNEKYPNNASSKFLNTLGESIEIPCYVDPQGKQFFLGAAIDSFRNEELLKQITALSKLYAVTKNEACATRIVHALAAYAEHFPHYLVKDFKTSVDDPPGRRGAQRSWYEFVSSGGPWLVKGRPRGNRPSEPEASQKQTTTPYGWTQSRWGWGRWEGETPLELLHAYDLIYDSPAFAELSQARGRDVRKEIEDQLFRNAAAYLLDYPFWYHIHNNASYAVAEIVRTGMVLNEPKFADFGHRWGRSVLEQYAFSREGAFGESPGYFYVFLATQADNFVALKEAAAYFGGGADDELTAQAQKSIDFLERSKAAIESVRFPNGSSLPISDNRHDEFVDPTFRPGVRGTVRDSSSDVILPGYGHAMLGAGTGDRQVQAHLHFSPFKEAIHTHRDGLSLMLWAFGCELYTDIGYNRTKYRGYASTTLSHNTVVVDRKPQDGATTKGRLLAYHHDPRGWSFVQVEDAHAYGEPLTRYRRSLLLNTRDLAAPYLVDVFEVRGGRMHDYALHGPTVFDSTAELDIPLASLPGARPLLLPGEEATFKLNDHPYGVFTKVRSGAVTSDFSVRYRLVDPYKLPEFTKNPRYPHGTSFQHVVDPQTYADRGEIGVQSRFVGLTEIRGESWTALLGETPSLLRGGLIGSPLTDKLQRPSLLVRHEGQEGLSSVYVVVHEPYYQAPKITAVRRLETLEPNAIALAIQLGDCFDTILLSLDGASVTVRGPQPATLAGRLAVMERAKGQSPQAWLVGGTSLRQDDFTLTAPTASYAGTIDGVTSGWAGAAENTFTTSDDLPAGDALAGRWMIVHHGGGTAEEGYRIARVERRGTQNAVVLTDDPGLRVSGDSTEEIFFPRRRWTGPNRFTILTEAKTP